MGNDTIANIITSIRNADIVKKKTVRIIATNTTKNVVRILLQEGFIEDAREHREGQKSFSVLTLRYRGRKEKTYITTSKRTSKPGLRIYSNSQKVPKVLGGMGVVILSTSQGIMTDREARRRRIGGEILCYVR
uniref:Small ribosomal subunit protein uS8c n=34 Tax=Cycas TaxID=3395 RepID=RR8_CYCTA|nr:ribosomal protein S8 [Cycas taitungensis]YP_009648015.1 ribosomal protein S8 [Cycas szechuanensis]YP_010227661.1 ribosomal protein S8 [Cycas hongheensis]YP_010410388.1 ribosomal protein S8 [Cycas falcata]YP_010410475.1 ribosomal protein S8 [Cycas thouarsii]YP_010410562.1 ribosomal protein S8 [Cycas micronesica]YP_010410649.1 ribosomal protein S8 [Cycas seemannii]YP_010410736.1 ribosomal protein S8 [Cycas zeylanica]YP_010410823.1 ribosomal protein S8 [Cycas edentata]YP_010410910.1 riboso